MEAHLLQWPNSGLMYRLSEYAEREKTINRGIFLYGKYIYFFFFQEKTIDLKSLILRWIDPTSESVLSIFMDVDGCKNNSANTVNYVEHVQCRISLKFFPRGDLRIVLTSPMGTESVLLFERPLDIVSSTFDDWPFLSVHYWGEKIVGRWELKITRRTANSTAKSPGNIFTYIIPNIVLTMIMM